MARPASRTGARTEETKIRWFKDELAEAEKIAAKAGLPLAKLARIAVLNYQGTANELRGDCKLDSQSPLNSNSQGTVNSNSQGTANLSQDTPTTSDAKNGVLGGVGGGLSVNTKIQSIAITSPPKNEFAVPSKLETTFEEDFETFWNCFPATHKARQPVVLKEWKKAIKKECSSEKILAAAKLYAASPAGKGDRCLGPLRWLQEQRWKDDPKSWGVKEQEAPKKESGLSDDLLEIMRRKNERAKTVAKQQGS
jgi:hypothetical protein